MCLECFSVPKLSFDKSFRLLKVSIVHFSIFRAQNSSKSEPMYAYKRYAYKKNMYFSSSPAKEFLSPCVEKMKQSFNGRTAKGGVDLPLSLIHI